MHSCCELLVLLTWIGDKTQKILKACMKNFRLFKTVIHDSLSWPNSMQSSYILISCFIPSFSLCTAVAAAAKSLQSCLTLCDPIDGGPPGSGIPGILQARILKWVAISFSSAWKWKVKVKSLSHVRLLATPWTVIRLPHNCTHLTR